MKHVCNSKTVTDSQVAQNEIATTKWSIMAVKLKFKQRRRKRGTKSTMNQTCQNNLQTYCRYCLNNFTDMFRFFYVFFHTFNISLLIINYMFVLVTKTN